MFIECVLEKLVSRKELGVEEIYRAAKEMLEEEDPAKTAAFLALLRAKGETIDEIVGLVKALREQALPAAVNRPFLDIVGTGGDRAGTVNISTGSALLAALSGVPVVKHGNRSVSSNCGSADVLEAMGFDIHAPINPESNFNFCFAPDYHPAMKKVRDVRKSIKIPTVFNLLGPLLNPAGISHLQIGVFKPELVPVMAQVLHRLGTKRSLVFHSNGLDELSCLGPVDALLVTEKGIEPMRIDPEALGLRTCFIHDLLQGKDAKQNGEMLLDVLCGKMTPLRDTLILNAAVGQFLIGMASSIEEGIANVKTRLGRISFKKAIQEEPISLIAEIKRRSPSKGPIGEISDPAKRAELYVEGGAVAISVLTDPSFDGKLSDLQEVSKGSIVPVLRKGFFYDQKDIRDAKLNGADAILLIVPFLKARTKEMLEEAKRFGLEALVEVHDESDLAIAIEAGAEIIGVNQRNLRDFTMHPETFSKLASKLPKGIAKIAASGVESKAEVEKVRKMGYHSVLVGEALTRSEDPVKFISELGVSHVG